MRYAEDCVIYVRSYKAVCRVMESVSCFISKRLKLKVNEAKSDVSYPWHRKFLGFSFTSPRGNTRIRLHSETIKRFKEKVRQLTAANAVGAFCKSQLSQTTTSVAGGPTTGTRKREVLYAR